MLKDASLFIAIKGRRGEAEKMNSHRFTVDEIDTDMVEKVIAKE